MRHSGAPHDGLPDASALVGRDDEVEAFRDLLARTAEGQGAALLLAGEAGIGKSRLLAEFAAIARQSGAVVITGLCRQEWPAPYGPFAEALGQYIRAADPALLREDFGFGAAPLARLIPAIHERLPDTPEPADLSPEEERLRLLDAVCQFLVALSARSPVLLMLDDLHWADEGSLAMLRSVARATRGSRVLIAGAYRDVEVDGQHPLARTLAPLRHETSLTARQVGGLEADAVNDLLRGVLKGNLSETLVTAIRDESAGNPFFVTEIADHLAGSGLLTRDAGTISAPPIAELGIPATVREAVQARLGGLPADARALLSVASAFAGPFPLAIAAAAADLSEPAALDAIDRAIGVRLLTPAGDADSYDFSHALVRNAIYNGMNPSRRVRLHRRLAEAIQTFYGGRAAEHAALLVYQYQQSAALPGAERGVDYALAGAENARRVYAWAEAARLYRAAIALMPEGDSRRTHATGQLGRVLIFTSRPEDAEPVVQDAAGLIDAESGAPAAAHYLADMVIHLASVGSPTGAPARLALRGLEFAGEARDLPWAILKMTVLNRQDADDPNSPGLEMDTPERLELSAAVRNLSGWQRAILSHLIFFGSRADLLAYLEEAGTETPALRAGNFRQAIPTWEREASRHRQNGAIGMAATIYSQLSRLRSAVGDLAEAAEAFATARALSARLPIYSNPFGSLVEARMQRTFARGEGWDRLAPTSEMFLSAVPTRGRAAAYAAVAQIYAEAGRKEDSLDLVSRCLPAIERGPGGSEYYPLVALTVVEALWILERTDHAGTIEDNVRRKVIGPDFRYTMRDARRSMGHLCALQGRHEEARDWFANARLSTEEDGQRPLRALCDFDEALMWVRRGRRGDRERANPLLQAALARFQEIGMTGWEARARDLMGSTRPAFPDRLTGREVEILRLIAAGRTNRQISDDLVLSLRTVARHAANIYAKIGASNKAEATAYAIKHGLRDG